MSGTGQRPVLIVEDHADFREALTAALQVEGYRVVSVSDGDEALRYLRTRERPCAVILDLHMPRLDGRQFLETVRGSAGDEVPVIVITGTAPPETTAAALGLPVAHCFLKPCEPAAVVQVLAPHCASAAVRQAS